MGLFDAPARPAGNRSEAVVFPTLPDSPAAFRALPQAALATPFDTAALTVLALCFYPQDRDAALEMLDYLRGPRPLTPYDRQFIRDRFMDHDYVARSYFRGATPANDYQPAQPYTVVVSENPYSYQNEGYAKLYLQSAGADSPRAVDLRKKGDGSWLLWEQFLLSDIRMPVKDDPWA